MYQYKTHITVFWLVLVLSLGFQTALEAQWKLPEGYSRPKGGMGIEGASIAKVLNTDKGVGSVQFTNPYTSNSMTTFAGVFAGSVDNNSAKFYCVDLQNNLAFWTSSNPHTYTDSNFTPSEISYILNNYYPSKPYPYAGAASTEENEAASIQLAIWHFSDGVNVNTVTNSTLKTRALQIIADATANHNNFVPLASLVVLPGIQNKQTGTPAQFTVGAYDAWGNGIPNITVTLSTTTGSLSSSSVVTGSNGVTPQVTLNQGSSNSATITAVATITIPQGTRYVHSSQPNNYQKLVLATPTVANNSGTGMVAWINQPGPCDLNNYITFTQGGWGSPSNSTPGHYRDTYFSSVFPSGAVIGDALKATFTTASAVNAFLPAGGTAAAFTQNYTNPLTTSAGVLAGQALALTFNIAFDQANVFGNHYTKLGNLAVASGPFAGKTVSQVLGYVNTALGGGSTPYTLTELTDAATKINENFDNGTVNKNYLTCPPVVVPGSIGDKVWNDLDKDGIQDAGEAGASGATVKLYDCGDVLIASTTTDANGNYLFSNVTPGSYYVMFTLPAGYSFSPKNAGADSTKDSDADLSTGKTSCFVLGNGQNNLSKDAGMFICYNKVGDYVWHDKDVDGIQDAGEPGLQGVVVELLQGATVVGTSTTDATGKYEFTNILNGAYSVRIAASNYTSGGVLFSTAQTKWYATKKNQGTDDTKDNDANLNESVPVTVSCADNVTIDFGFYKTDIKVTKTANVSSAVPGDVITYTFTVENPGDITLSGGVDFYDALINPSGNHLIGNVTPVPPGTTKQLVKTYTVKSTDCGPLVNIVTAIGHPIDGSANVEHKDTLTVTVICKASVGDKVWNDINFNGIQDAGEAGIANVAVQLFTCADVPVASTTTDANGLYSFNNVDPGSYYIKFTAPSQYVITLKDAGSDDAKDSDADPSTGKTACFTLVATQNDITRDAGMYLPPASVGDKVWNDVNYNGIQDAGENGIPNVTVKLYDCSDVLIATTTTDANGLYSFTNIAPGSYYIHVAAPSGYTVTLKDAGSDDAKDSDIDPATGKTACFTLTPGQNDLTRDAGMYPTPTSVGDKVWNDANKNGIQDAGEGGMPNVTVKLYDCSDVLVATTTTDANGVYSFLNLAPGSYYVQFSAPSGYTITMKDAGSDDAKDSDADPATGKTACFTLTPGQVDITRDAGMYVTPASVGDKVWFDTNKNGIQDAGEAGIANVTVTLYDCSDVLIASTTTDANGLYSFTNLAPGSYYVKFTAPSGYMLTSRDAGSDDAKDSDADPATGKTACFTLTPGQNDLTRDAGMYLIPASVGDKVWYDNNLNGVQDAGEAGVPNVSVKLYDCSDNLIATTTTDANGLYGFANLTPGSYYIKFVLPASHIFTAYMAGTDTTKNSDANTSTGKTVCFTLSPGQNDPTRDAGMILTTASVGDRVWNDANRNGIQDVGEGNIPNVTVKLYTCADVLLATTTTNGSGNYSFNNLAPGSYYVKFDLPANYMFTTQFAGTDTTLNSDANATTGKTNCFTLAAGQSDITRDAGMYLIPASLGDKVWNDLDKDGIQDAGESGIPNVTVKLYDCSDVLIGTTITDANGVYGFTLLTPGSYYVQFVAPSGYTVTLKDAGSDDAKDSDADPVTGKTACFTLAAGQNDLTRDAGMYLMPGTIGDFVWNDVDKDGIQDAGEAGIPNVTVKLYDCSNTFIATTTTDANGAYSFVGVPSGSYYVQFITPSGYNITAKDAGSDDTKDSDADVSTGKTACFTLNPGQNDLTRDAGMYIPQLLPVTIGDRVWNDANQNGIQDNGEIGISNVTVKLYTCADSLIATTATNGAGLYQFTNIPAGSYYVKFMLPYGYTFTAKDQGSIDSLDSDANTSTGKTGCYNVVSGEVNKTIDAGMFVNFVTIGDKVWNDLDKDGVQDPNEPGIPNVTVKLYDCANNLIATTVTDANGMYQFCCSIGGGSYYVEFVLPSGYTFSPADQGSDDALDSDANTSTGKTNCISITGGQMNLTLDAGMYQLPVTIGDKVWNDIDKDGVQDAGEAGIPNVTVSLFNCSGVLIATTTTDANGLYQFANVPAGNYYVQFTAPSGYAFSPANQGSNTGLDSDADPLTGKTACKTFAAGTTDNTIDAGMYFGATDLKIEKTVNDSTIVCGQYLTYTIKVTNNGPINAGGIVVTDILPAGLDFVSVSASQGTYYVGTGDWMVGSLNNGAFATLTLYVQVNCSTINTANIDLGPAKNYNVFALVDFKPSSADVQGRLAVGRDAVLGGYSVGDQLPPSGGTVDVLVVGRDLQFTSGGVWGGNVVYGNTSNLPASAVTIFDGTVRKDTVIDFAAAKTYLENLSTQLGGYAVNGTTTFQWGTLNLTHTDPYLNVFSVSGSDLSTAHTVQINVPNGSAVVVNITGTNISWRGGLFVNGTAMNNVLYNFPQATSLTISGIDVRGALLAPFADLNFPAGLISGQAIFKSMVGSGQFNIAPFLGNIPANKTIVNVASISASNTTDLNPSNNTSSASASFPADTTGGGSGGGSGSGGWQLIGNLPVGETVTCLESDHQGGIYAGTVNGYIYKTTDNGATWVRVNPFMYSGPVWAIEVHPNGSILAATVTGVYRTTNNGSSWELTALQYKDTRTLKIDAQGNVYAGTWGFGMYVSTNCGLTWSQSNNGLGTHLIVTSVTVTPNQNVFAGTFDGGVFKSIDHGASWIPVNVGYNYIWALASNSDGDLFAGTYGDGLYRSLNNGGTWTKTSFPAAHVYELRIDAADNVFAASYSGGVFVSTNKGLTWTNIGMGGMALSSMLIVPNGRTVFTGTSGGQIYMKASNLTSVKTLNDEKPTAFTLNQNYPNPFNPSTVVRYALPFEAKVNVRVYNITGQEVAVLAQGTANAGNYEVSFEAKNLPSGLYICTMNAVSSDGKEKFNATRKMMLVK